MVRARRRILVPVVALAVLLLVALMGLSVACTALAREGDEEKATITEEYTLTLDGVGTGHIVDKLNYVNSDDYDVIKKVAKENPKYLSRRYTQDTNIGEAENFKAKLDDASKSVTLTFDTPGYAYCMKDFWVVYGFPDKPENKGKKAVEIKGSSVINNEFTLFTDQKLDYTNVVEFPKNSSDVRYDENDHGVRYNMPPAEIHVGFFSDNKTILMLLFGLLTLALGGAALFFYRRAGEAAPVTAGGKVAGEPPGPEPATSIEPVEPISPPVTAPEPKVETPPPPPVEKAPVEDAPGKVSKFCGRCGMPLTPGKKFCTHCGKHT